MSIILKGIDLPKEGEEITLAIFHDGDIVSYKYWLPKEAEAIQIPKGHGRLIDASKLIKSYMKGTKTDIDDFYDTIDIIDNAPTIIEAEE